MNPVCLNNLSSSVVHGMTSVRGMFVFFSLVVSTSQYYGIVGNGIIEQPFLYGGSVTQPE